MRGVPVVGDQERDAAGDEDERCRIRQHLRHPTAEALLRLGCRELTHVDIVDAKKGGWLAAFSPEVLRTSGDETGQARLRRACPGGLLWAGS